jgi:Domain of unknown function (DUF5658)
MRTAIVRLGSAIAIVCWLLCGAQAASAQEAPPGLLPIEPLEISVADLQSAFLKGGIETERPQLTAPRLAAEPRRPQALVPLYASLIVLQGLDIHSTRSAIASGGREANPAMRGVVKNSAAFVAVKAGATAGVIWASEKMWKKNRKAAVIFAAIVNGAVAAVVANNYRRDREQ